MVGPFRFFTGKKPEPTNAVQNSTVPDYPLAHDPLATARGPQHSGQDRAPANRPLSLPQLRTTFGAEGGLAPPHCYCATSAKMNQSQSNILCWYGQHFIVPDFSDLLHYSLIISDAISHAVYDVQICVEEHAW